MSASAVGARSCFEMMNGKTAQGSLSSNDAPGCACIVCAAAGDSGM
jgi:hypothetical protein